MAINIICIGAIKERFYEEAVKEYTKRLGAYTKLNIIEFKDEKIPKNASVSDEEKIKEAEGEKILAKLKQNDFVIALCIDGKNLSSVEFAGFMEDIEIRGRGNINFVIGGSLGLSKSVINRADYKLSFSKMTFPHQLMRVIFLEQLYRTYKIRNGGAYHK